MKNTHLVVILGAGVVVACLAVMSRSGTSHSPTPDYNQPLPGRARSVSAAEILSAPGQFHHKRIVLEGVWRRGFETSIFELVDGQSLSIWVNFWDTKEFLEESGKFFEKVAPEMVLAVDAQLKLRAEGSFFYRSRAHGGGFGHLGAAESLFLVDRILLLERVDGNQPNK